MKELPIEKIEMVSGGCSFVEMMFYASGQMYHIGGIAESGKVYHYLGVGYYTTKLFGCM